MDIRGVDRRGTTVAVSGMLPILNCTEPPTGVRIILIANPGGNSPLRKIARICLAVSLVKAVVPVLCLPKIATGHEY